MKRKPRLGVSYVFDCANLAEAAHKINTQLSDIPAEDIRQIEPHSTQPRAWTVIYIWRG